ncbi:MAG TPA: glycosyltransferase family 4 protein [Pirellulales bacterium]|jgi:glycosyltransferase involved in cell wall biosynthesis|nr:glycosyltransferase family 4 protein [Pirellulales bacterium]
MIQPPEMPGSKGAGSSLRIVYLTAGAATRYCGSCLHDNGLAKALAELGEDILLVPAYTPLRTDEENVSLNRVFFGGVNVYLQQNSSVFRHTPWFLDRWFDSPKFLNWLAQRSAGMEFAKLGALTVSTLQGEQGRQRKELEKLLQWLEQEGRPEVIHLSNALLLGMAGRLRKKLNVPIVCGLAGEDLFLEQLSEPYYSQARQLLRERAKDVDVFVAYNRYFADFMADYLGIPRSRIEVIRHGLHLAGHGERQTSQPGQAFTVGYFSRIAPEKGLHLLIEAFALLRADGSGAPLPPLRLKAAGYKSSGDEQYFQSILKRVQQLGLADQFEFTGELDRAGKIAFLQSLDVMSVPTVYRESKGLSILESLANGVPVVVPRHGSFPEIIEHTGGGLLCEAENPADLAAKLREYVLNPALAADHGRRGREVIHTHYTAAQMAQEHRSLYRQVSTAARKQ